MTEKVEWVIPATPGYSVWIEDDGELVGPTPVIGWRVERIERDVKTSLGERAFFYTTTPITPEYFAIDDDQEHLVQWPDGRMDSINETYPSLEEARRCTRKVHVLGKESK